MSAQHMICKRAGERLAKHLGIYTLKQPKG